MRFYHQRLPSKYAEKLPRLRGDIFDHLIYKSPWQLFTIGKVAIDTINELRG